MSRLVGRLFVVVSQHAKARSAVSPRRIPVFTRPVSTSQGLQSLTRYDENTDWQKKLSPEQYVVTREKGTEMFHFSVQRLSMTLGQAGQHLKRPMGHGSGTKATPPSFVALTTAWEVLGLRSFVKIAIPTWVMCLTMDQTRQVSGSVSTAWLSRLNPEETAKLTRMSRTDVCVYLNENTVMFYFTPVNLGGKLKVHLNVRAFIP
ncbi:hypothetical protein FQN60_013824 [Etheostoma spectabile]|uniref:Uncharacterized protein n=1 Tax=Etheostoma spectabile TaxID=54343 RepID=A0A5J5CK11_9PERO|nr:hypothetical protein FQN60_013824 [Etheostoma spectabile]